MASDVQVPPEHYEFERYDDLQRWASYWYQIREAMRLRPKRVVEIGPGSGVFNSYLRNAGIEVTTVDIDDTRKPDLVADAAELDQALPAGEHYDIIAAFQILEHLPYDRLDDCLAGIARRADHALISLPSNGFQLRGSLGIGGLVLKAATYLPYKWSFNSQHFWELGFRYSIGKVTRAMEKRFEIVRRYRIKENPYHVMWVLRSRLAAD